MRKVARVLFDEAHSQAWTVRPEVAQAMQPAHPADSSYVRASEALEARDFTVAVHAEGALDGAALGAADVLVLAHPSDPRWEKTVPGSGAPVLSGAELDAIEAFVARGGGLVLLAEEEQDKYGSNLADLAARFGIGVQSTIVSDYEHFNAAPTWVKAELGEPRRRGVDLLARVRQACFYRAGVLEPANGARVIARTSPTASSPGAPLLAIAEHGAGRVAVLADSDLFGDDCIGELDHEALWTNLVYWVAQPSFAAEVVAAPSAAQDDPHWAALKAATDELRLLQEPDGSTTHDVAALVATMAASVEGLAPHFPHQAAYLEAVVADLRAWDGGKPDFTRALEAFRLDQHRVDGSEHLVVFPMYLQNASRDTRFESLIIRVPWPEWLADLERERYDNPKFVPVTFVDHTAGYDSECAVLFPETVSVAGKPVNHFGGIFCDREAARFGRVISAATELLEVNLPPDAAALLASPELARDAYLLWDLVHDRTHSHGDLPFDPFMIRQRSPYWMYSLEELRCDLTAFGEAVRLEARGLRVRAPRAVRDPLRPAVPLPDHGHRVRNYDGLGGQLLFAYLHKHGFIHWTDNQLTVEWERVADGVQALRARSRSSTARASTARRSRTGSPRTSSSRPTCRRRPARSGPAASARSPTSPTRRRGSTSSSPTSSRCRCSTCSSRASSTPGSS
jgi:hypothetical protein